MSQRACPSFFVQHEDEVCRDQTDSLNHILICYEWPLLEGLRVFRRACEIRQVLELRENK